MADRRQAHRFVLPERVHGSLRIMEDVFVERVNADGIVIVVGRPPATCEDLLLDLVPNGGRRRVLRVRAARSSPLGIAEASRYRVTLFPAEGRCFVIDGATEGASPKEPAAGIGVLVRRIPMSLRDVSARGCLIESAHALPEGTVGVLELVMAEGRSAEQVRICRMARIRGGILPYAAGAEFLPLEPPMPASVRNMIARLEMVLKHDSRTTVNLAARLSAFRHDDTADDGKPSH
jgi:hypothetical protein